MNLNGKRIAIAKTNHMGDVIISLAMAGMIKAKYPKSRVIFLCRSHNTAIAKLSPFIDEVYEWQQFESISKPAKKLQSLDLDIFIHTSPCAKISNLVKRANVPTRVGSAFRLYHWLSCNRLSLISRDPRVNKRILDLQYLKSLGFDTNISPKMLLQYARLAAKPLKKAHQSLLSKTKFNLVLHPGSVTANAHGWGVENYKALIKQLDKSKFHILVSGIDSERNDFTELLKLDGVVDLMGRMSLKDYANFISKIDGMVAGSTGPLHLANAFQKYTLGLYRHNKKDINRWCPIGKKSSILSSKQGVQSIEISKVIGQLKDWC